jgi:hypothetical protein
MRILSHMMVMHRMHAESFPNELRQTAEQIDDPEVRAIAENGYPLH